jgi:diacylglycerol kinase family enzyme
MIAATIGSAGLESMKGFSVWPGVSEFTVSAPTPQVVQADGEILGRFDRVRASLTPDALAVAVPRRPEPHP